jgi:hypothetical protein
MKTYEQMTADVLRRRNEELAEQAKKHKNTRRVVLAASVCLLTVGVTAGIWGGMVLNRPNDGTTEIGGTTKPTPEIQTDAPASGAFWDDLRERKDINVMIPETSIEWRWEDMTDDERYTNLDLDGETYHMRGTVTNYLGEWLESGEAYGFAWDQDNARHGIPCEIYFLTFSTDHSVVAVQFEGSSEIYRFERERKYDPPKTLGEFMETRKLSQVLPLTTLYYERREGGSSVSDKMALSAEHSDGVWAILAKYGDASFIEPSFKESFEINHYDKEEIGFSATSEVLGIRNLSFTVNDKGYVITNIELYGYHYHIGVDAAREIIDYVKAHMTEPLPDEKSTVYYIVGTVTEKGDGYIKVDDSIMMKNPEDGLTFTIDVTDKKLGRVCNLLISVGDHVLITYDGRISEDGSLLVENAASIQEAWITEDGDVLIPE